MLIPKQIPFLSVILFILNITHNIIAQNTSTSGSVKQIEIIHADILKYNKNINANRLIGNVICKHENTMFYCDSAYLYPNQSLQAFGNIRIISDSLSITAQSLLYDATTKNASLEKDVICNDPSIQLKTQVLQYNTQSKVAYYLTQGEIIRKEHILTSYRGYYYSLEKKLAFKQNVVLKNPDYTIQTDTLYYYITSDIAHFNAPTIILLEDSNQTNKTYKDYLYCEKGWYDTKNKKAYFSKNPVLYSDNKKLYADSLFYDENNNIGQAYKNIRLIDTSQHTTIKGHYAIYNLSTENAMITQHPILIKIHEQKDTLFITADTLYYQKKDSNIIAKGTHNSKMYHHQFQSTAQHIIYSQKDSTIQLYPQPLFWFKNNQASSKVAVLFLSNNSIDKIILDTNVIIVQEADSIYHNKFNQVSGRQMKIFFQNDSIKNIYVDGNAQVYYFLANEQHQWTGLNKAKCSKIRIDFLNNEIHKIVFIDNPETQLIPIKKIQPEKEKLPHFNWQPQLRPLRKDF